MHGGPARAQGRKRHPSVPTSAPLPQARVANDGTGLSMCPRAHPSVPMSSISTAPHLALCWDSHPKA